MKVLKSISHSSRSFFKRCQWAWQRRYVDNLQHATRESTALWFGSGIHEALEAFYNTPTEKRSLGVLHGAWCGFMDARQGDVDYINTFHDGDFHEAVEARQLGLEMLENYWLEYQQDSDVETICAEKPFDIRLPFETIDGEQTDTRLVGFFDLVFRSRKDGLLYLMEHKTTSATRDAHYLPLEDQAGVYATASTYVLRKEGLIGPSEFITGVVYNYLQKKGVDRRPRNPEGFVCNKPLKKHFIEALSGVVEAPEKMSVKQLEKAASDQGIQVFGEPSAQQPATPVRRVLVKKTPKQLASQLRRLQSDAKVMLAVESDRLPATKNPTRECSFCEFKELCELDENCKDWREAADHIYTDRKKR